MEVVVKKSKKPPKDPNIQEGMPLPDFGTCKHYKHSYRWLRFPCCGKAYPCDVCHDKNEDHEMVFANRMICGHCCREQVSFKKSFCLLFFSFYLSIKIFSQLCYWEFILQLVNVNKRNKNNIATLGTILNWIWEKKLNGRNCLDF